MSGNILHKSDFSRGDWDEYTMHTLLFSEGGISVAEHPELPNDTRFQDHDGFVWIANEFDARDLMPDTPENIIAEIKAVGTKMR